MRLGSQAVIVATHSSPAIRYGLCGRAVPAVTWHKGSDVISTVSSSSTRARTPIIRSNPSVLLPNQRDLIVTKTEQLLAYSAISGILNTGGLVGSRCRGCQLTTHSPRHSSRILPRTMFTLIVVCALCHVSAALSAPMTIVIAAVVTDAQGRTTDAQATLTVLGLPNAVTLDAAKSLEDGSVVQVQNLIASTSSSGFAGVFYAQRSDRSGGIGILWDDGSVSCGDIVTVVGSLTTLHGERFIQAQVVD
jgi:hypothetical protein